MAASARGCVTMEGRQGRCWLTCESTAALALFGACSHRKTELKIFAQQQKLAQQRHAPCREGRRCPRERWGACNDA